MGIQKVVIMGATGKVGSELVSQIEEHDMENNPSHDNPTRIVGMSNSRGHVLIPEGISMGRRLVTDKDLFNQAATPSEHYLDILRTANKMGFQPGELVFVDVTADGSMNMLYLHHMILQANHKIATANKNPLSRFSPEHFKDLTRNRGQYAFNASVMAGGDAVPFLQDSVNLGATVSSIEGCFSGTLGFICSKLDEGMPISEIIKEAHKAGYTEPNPWDDLNGLDVARKLVILARSAGLTVSMEDINIRAFMDESWNPSREIYEGNLESWFNGIKGADPYFANLVASAKRNGNVLRYVAELKSKDGQTEMSVGLKEVPKNSDIGALNGTNNLVKIVAGNRATNKHPKIIQEAGAGIPKTAEAVRADLLRFIQHLRAS